MLSLTFKELNLKNFVIVLVFLAAHITWANDCVEVRAGLDIGSGATKIKWRKLIFVSKSLSKILFSDKRAVGYKQDLKESANNQMSLEIIDLGVKNINELKALAQRFKPVSYIAAATSAFRTASNGVIAANIISRKNQY